MFKCWVSHNKPVYSFNIGSQTLKILHPVSFSLFQTPSRLPASLLWLKWATRKSATEACIQLRPQSAVAIHPSPAGHMTAQVEALDAEKQHLKPKQHTRRSAYPTSGDKPIPSQHLSISPSLSLCWGGIVNQIKILSCTNDILHKCWNNEGEREPWKEPRLRAAGTIIQKQTKTPYPLLSAQIDVVLCRVLKHECMSGSQWVSLSILCECERGQYGLHTISTSETGPKLVTKMSVLTSVTGPMAQE